MSDRGHPMRAGIPLTPTEALKPETKAQLAAAREAGIPLTPTEALKLCGVCRRVDMDCRLNPSYADGGIETCTGFSITWRGSGAGIPLTPTEALKPHREGCPCIHTTGLNPSYADGGIETPCSVIVAPVIFVLESLLRRLRHGNIPVSAWDRREGELESLLRRLRHGNVAAERDDRNFVALESLLRRLRHGNTLAEENPEKAVEAGIPLTPTEALKLMRRIVACLFAFAGIPLTPTEALKPARSGRLFFVFSSLNPSYADGGIETCIGGKHRCRNALLESLLRRLRHGNL